MQRRDRWCSEEQSTGSRSSVGVPLPSPWPEQRFSRGLPNAAKHGGAPIQRNQNHLHLLKVLQNGTVHLRVHGHEAWKCDGRKGSIIREGLVGQQNRGRRGWRTQFMVDGRRSTTKELRVITGQRVTRTRKSHCARLSRSERNQRRDERLADR